MSALRDGFPDLDETVNATLGDTITYSPCIGNPTFDTWVEFGNAEVSSGNSAAKGEQIVIEVPFSRVAVPAREDRIRVALRPGQIYSPAQWDVAGIGNAWRIILKREAA